MPEEGPPAGRVNPSGEPNDTPAPEVKPVAAAKAETSPAAPPPAKPPTAAAAKPAAPAAKPAAAKAPAVMAATPWTGDLPDQVKQEFGDSILECSAYLGQEFIVVKPTAALAVIGYLTKKADYDYLVDVTAVHYPKRAGEEFDLFYILYSFSRNHRLRVKARLADGAAIASVTSVHAGANWLERECFDMFGIRFDGHPDLKRILLPDEWEGHPLRKDYSIIKMDERWVRENLGIESAQ